MPHVLAGLLALLFTFLWPLPTRADLAAAVRRSSAGGQASPLAVNPVTGVVVIPLRKVRAQWGPRADRPHFYLGNLTIGHPPQQMEVTFDTASGHVLLPHRACKSPACLEHRRYSPWESSTAVDVNFNGRQVQANHRFARGKGMRDAATLGFTESDLGEGNATSVLVRDIVCLGTHGAREACVDMAVLAAIKLEDVPFRALPSDGVFGLGLDSLAATPMCSFFGRLLEGSKGMLPQFGISFGAGGAELRLGGHDLSRLAEPLEWLPVARPRDGYWQVAIKAVRLGNVTIEDCQRGCHGIVDTGVSRLGVQTSRLPAIKSALVSGLTKHGRCRGPDLSFDLGSITLTLRSDGYSAPDCTVQVGPLNLEEPDFVGVFAFGEALLRDYYVGFDWEERRVGFAPLAGRTRGSRSAAPGAAGSMREVFVF